MWEIGERWLRKGVPHEFNDGTDDGGNDCHVNVWEVFDEVLESIFVFAHATLVVQNACMVLRGMEFNAEARAEEALPEAETVGGGSVFADIAHKGDKKLSELFNGGQRSTGPNKFFENTQGLSGGPRSPGGVAEPRRACSQSQLCTPGLGRIVACVGWG